MSKKTPASTPIDVPDLPATSDPTHIKMMGAAPEPRTGEQHYPTNVTLDPSAPGTSSQGSGASGSDATMQPDASAGTSETGTADGGASQP